MMNKSKRQVGSRPPSLAGKPLAFDPGIRMILQKRSLFSHIAVFFLATVAMFLQGACSMDQLDRCDGRVDRSIASSIEGSWTPDPTSLPEELNNRGRESVLQSRIVFGDSGYRFYGKDRPVHFMPFAGLEKSDKMVQVFFRSSAGLCESMEVELLSEKQIQIRIYSDYPVIRYSKENTL